MKQVRILNLASGYGHFAYSDSYPVFTFMPPLEKRYRLDYMNQRRAAGRELVRKACDKPCADCGQSYPSYVMDFDHRQDTEKKFNVSEWWHKSSSLKTLQEEIDKCDVVCANCHRIRTWQDASLSLSVD